MKSTCIHHPAKETLIMIRKWQLEFCDGNHCAAALLSFFEYWHNIKLELSQRARQANDLARTHGKPATHDESLFQFHTDEDLRVGLLGLYGTMKIRSGRRLLVTKGAITEHPNPTPRYAFDKTIYYLFHDDVINAWLARYSSGLSSAKNGERVAKNGERVAKNGERVAKNGERSSENLSRINDLEAPASQITTEITTETTTTTQHAPQNERAQQPEELGGSGSSNLNLIFDFNLEALSEAQRQRAAKILESIGQKTAQQVLDEFNYAMGCGCIKKSKWAWLQSVARSAREGSFVPTSDLADRRQAQLRIDTAQPPQRKPSQVWEEHYEELLSDGITPADYHTYIAPLRGSEDGRVLWLEAPNSFAADWVLAHLPQIEQVMKPHTTFPIRVCIG